MPGKVRQVKPTGIKTRIRAFFNKYKKMLKAHIQSLLFAPGTRNAVLVVAVSVSVILFCFHKMVALLKLLFYRRRFQTLMKRAVILQENDPSQSVLCLYRALRLMLILAHLERQKNMELLAYASEVSKTYSVLLQKQQHVESTPEAEKQNMEKSRKLEQDLRFVFKQFYSLEYGNCLCSATDAAKCTVAVTAIHTALKEVYPNSLLQ